MDVWKQFEENGITHSAAHHLIAVLELKNSRGYARVTDVAKALNITTGSASTNLKNLKQKNLIIEDENRFLDLSAEGERLASMVLRRKKVLKDFFVEILEVDPTVAEIDVCKTEHLISLEATEKLESFIKKHQKGPGRVKQA